MFETPVRVRDWNCPNNHRILVISDVHGNLDYFKGLLRLVDFGAEDELVIDGDFLEKGPDSLGTLRYIMELCKAGNVHPLIGNCDSWDEIFRESAELDKHLLYYMNKKRSGLLWDMCRELGIDTGSLSSFTPCKARLRESYGPQWDFLASLPHAIETNSFVFAHAGMMPDKPLREHRESELTHWDRFLSLGWSFPKWLVVGHYPVMLYGEDRVCANPIINRERKIISIDGACVLKDDGQLNALIIPAPDSEDFSFVAFDHFPERRVLDAQAEGGRSYYIRWGDSRVKVLQRGAEFSRCRHLRTGYEMDILTKYLFTEDECTDCNDCTDYVLPLKPGDTVRVVEETSRGYFVKHNGYSGWYFGRLE